jgi:beta-galactosidase
MTFVFSDTFRLVAAVVLGAVAAALAAVQPGVPECGDRVKVGFNTGWLFRGSDVPDGQSVALADSAFDSVTLPHSVASYGRAGVDTAIIAKISWYRKHFTLPEQYRGRRIAIEFQAVAKVAEVFCNGRSVGSHKGAYTPFTVDITDCAVVGGDNVVAVRVDSRQRKDLPPEGKEVDYIVGGGIVRDVALVITNQLHIEWGYARRDSARGDCLDVAVRIVNQSRSASAGTLRILLIDSASVQVASAELPYSLPAGGSQEVHRIVGPVDKIKLWHPDRPHLYALRLQLREKNSCPDAVSMPIGIRSVSFGRADGVFSINGQPLKLRGLNRHETFPFFGRAAANRLQRRDADIIKYDFGCNVVRCSHYPQDPEFLARCDEIGLMVLEEMAGWNYVSAKKEWQETALVNLTEMVMRDRNHPSIISFGVRVNQSSDFDEFYTATNRIARTLAPDRPTHGVRVLGRGVKDGFFEDVWAQNFFIPAKSPPQKPWVTTEVVGHTYPTHAWDAQSRLVGQFLRHAAVHDSFAANPEIAGGLGWCAFDYQSPYHGAEKGVCYHGVADMYRNPKHAALLYRSQADPALYGPMVHIAHYWEEFMGTADIRVASNCDSVAFFVNNRSLGRASVREYTSLPYPLFVWRKVPFEAGEIKAVGYIGGRQVALQARHTPGPAVKLSVVADDTVLSAGGDMTRVVVSACDSAGQAVPHECSVVRVSSEGPAEFYGEHTVALEAGQTAFFLKTGIGKGMVRCRAESEAMKPAETVVAVRE